MIKTKSCIVTDEAKMPVYIGQLLYACTYRATLKLENIPLKSTQTGIQFEKGIKISVVPPKFAQSFSPKTLSAGGGGVFPKSAKRQVLLVQKRYFLPLLISLLPFLVHLELFIVLFKPY